MSSIPTPSSIALAVCLDGSITAQRHAWAHEYQVARMGDAAADLVRVWAGREPLAANEYPAVYVGHDMTDRLIIADDLPSLEAEVARFPIAAAHQLLRLVRVATETP